jgi:hypothetical protein
MNKELESIRKQLGIQQKYLTADNIIFNVKTKEKTQATEEDIKLFDAVDLIEETLRRNNAKNNT